MQSEIISAFFFDISKTIDEIYIFSTAIQAKKFFLNINQIDKPENIFQLGGTNVYVDTVVSVSYYTNNSYSGSFGQVKTINGLDFTYTSNSSWNKNSGVEGKISKVGNKKITYWTDAGYTERGNYRGNIKSFGTKQFKYEGWSSWGEKAGMVGQLINLGDLKIDYYDTDYDIGYKGKLKSIGNVKFIYFDNSYNNKKANIVGKFKERTGQDRRFIIN